AVFLAAILAAWTPRGVVALEGGLARFSFSPVDYTIGKLLDEFILDPILEKVGWKPSLTKIDERLMELEKNAALRAEQREAIRKLREEIAKCATRKELEDVASKFKSDLRVINRRLDSAEDDLEELKVKFEDKEKGKKNSEDPDYFVTRGKRQFAYKEHFKALA